jgi:site-specific DNA recombinase
MYYTRPDHTPEANDMTTQRKLRAGIHARRSLNRSGEQSASVRRQIEQGTALAASINADVVTVYDEDDTSAFKKKLITLPNGRRVRRNVRPDWQRALTDLHDGTIDVLIEYDLDRAMREPRDLEDLIEIVETTKRQVESVTGSLRLRNDHEITMARVMVAMANKSSRDTARRVRDSARDRAIAGGNHGGRRSFGYTLDGLHLVPTEAQEIARMVDELLRGTPLGALARDLNNREVPTVIGGPWTPGSIRGMVQRPRVAGLAEYQGEIVGKGQWPAIITEEQLQAVKALLADPARRTTTGNRAAYLLSGLMKCALCGQSITSFGIKRDGGRTPRHLYRCRRNACAAIRRDHADLYVTERVFERLSRPDAAELLIDQQRPDVDALRDEAHGIRIRLDEAAASFARPGGIDLRQLDIITAQLNTRLREIEQVQQHTSRGPVLRDLVEAGERMSVVWESMTLDRQRAVVDCLMSIRLHKGGSGRRAFDPTKIEITPKD